MVLFVIFSIEAFFYPIPVVQNDLDYPKQFQIFRSNYAPQTWNSSAQAAENSGCYGWGYKCILFTKSLDSHQKVVHAQVQRKYE